MWGGANRVLYVQFRQIPSRSNVVQLGDFVQSGEICGFLQVQEALREQSTPTFSGMMYGILGTLREVLYKREENRFPHSIDRSHVKSTSAPQALPVDTCKFLSTSTNLFALRSTQIPHSGSADIVNQKLELGFHLRRSLVSQLRHVADVSATGRLLRSKNLKSNAAQHQASIDHLSSLYRPLASSGRNHRRSRKLASTGTILESEGPLDTLPIARLPPQEWPPAFSSVQFATPIPASQQPRSISPLSLCRQE
jgi:hypothetical protein